MPSPLTRVWFGLASKNPNFQKYKDLTLGSAPVSDSRTRVRVAYCKAKQLLVNIIASNDIKFRRIEMIYQLLKNYHDQCISGILKITGIES